ncbi:50S ribosomal protein L11 methyltransferase [Candidatus Terasakiella magnetica]|nr:50S ribosomal protein L11 methyltransferase [Candidatus Terasakiella magnetica]
MAKPSDTIKRLLSQGASELAGAKYEAARKTFETALEIENDNISANYFLAATLEELDETDLAVETYLKVIKLDATVRQAYIQLSNIFYTQDKKQSALGILETARHQFPKDKDILYLRGQVAMQCLPGWHLPMLADQERNDLYEKAINATVRTGDIALDIGTGSGLLAMMAVRAGAAHVYACESEPFVAELARQIVEKNGLSDKITVINKRSNDLVVGEDLPQKVDIVLTEIFDRALVGEGILPTLNHAWKNLLNDGARIIPQGATLYGVVIECPHLQRFHHLETVNGFDLSEMNVLAHPLAYKDGMIDLQESEDHRILSEPFIIRKFDFRYPPPLNFREKCPVNFKQDGTGDAILMWFDLHLTHDLTFSTQKPKPRNHWRQAAQILLKPQPCEISKPLMLKTYYRNYFDFELGKETKKTLKKVK